MQGLWKPVGNHPPAMYWVRRAFVLLAAALIIFAGIRGVEALTFASADRVEATPAAAATSAAPGAPAKSETSSPTPSAPITELPRHPQSGSAAPTSPIVPPLVPPPSLSPTSAPPCDLTRMRVTLVGARDVFTPGTQPMDMSVINGSGQTCSLDINQNSLDLTISSGSTTIWTTQHCSTWIPPGTAVLAPEEAKSWKVSWPTRMSAKTCKVTSGTLPEGTYVAALTLRGGPEPAKLVMELTKG